MIKTSCTKLLQTYLARRSDAKLSWFRKGEEFSGWPITTEGFYVTGATEGQGPNIFLKSSEVLEDFANVKSEPQQILQFTRRYGPLKQGDLDWEGPDDDPSNQWPTDLFRMPCERWLKYQERIREYWLMTRSNKAALVEALSAELGALPLFGPSGLGLASDPRRGLVIRLQAQDLWQALCLMLVNVSDDLRKCENESCPTLPYFIATRKDQKFCNEMCSRRVANRRWWREQGQEWRSRRSTKTSKKRR